MAFPKPRKDEKGEVCLKGNLMSEVEFLTSLFDEYEIEDRDYVALALAMVARISELEEKLMEMEVR